MNLPSLPTESLYKFISISGVTLIVISLYYPTIDWRNYRDLINSYNGEAQLIRKEREILGEDLKRIEKHVTILSKRLKIEPLLVVTDSSYTFSKTIIGSKEEENLTLTVEELLNNYHDNENKIELKSVELSNKDKQIEAAESDLETSQWIFFFVGGLGALLCLFGFDNWYSKNQRVLDLLQSNELLSKGIWRDRCQSCAKSFHVSTNVRGLEANGNISLKFCSNCYQNGLFIEPDLELHAMKERIKSDLKIKKYSKLLIWAFASQIKNLDRWKHKNFY
jgi:hypothetical protein